MFERESVGAKKEGEHTRGYKLVKLLPFGWEEMECKVKSKLGCVYNIFSIHWDIYVD